MKSFRMRAGEKRVRYRNRSGALCNADNVRGRYDNVRDRYDNVRVRYKWR